METKKITLATVKNFLKKNHGQLFINVKDKFSGMTDGIESVNSGFDVVVESVQNSAYTLGITGAWFVGSSRDHFQAYEDDKFKGILVYNCCGTFILAIEK